jgi:Secreted repeat of unknown function
LPSPSSWRFWRSPHAAGTDTTAATRPPPRSRATTPPPCRWRSSGTRAASWWTRPERPSTRRTRKRIAASSAPAPCTSFWIPLTIGAGAPSGNALPGKLGVVERGDGARQVTFEAKRLYTFVDDEPGEATGHGFSDAFDGQQFTWHVISVGDTPDSSQEDGDTGGSFGY